MNIKTKKRILNICFAGIIAGMYVVLTYISAIFNLASGPIQIRISEALCILPYFSASAIPGVTIGCLLANIFFSGNIFDIVFGTLATLIGASLAYALRKYKWLVPLPTILSNVLIIPFVLKYAFHLEETVIYFMVTIFIGEFISVGVLGILLLLALEKRKIYKKN